MTDAVALYASANLALSRELASLTPTPTTFAAVVERQRSGGALPPALHRELCRATNRIVMAARKAAPQPFPGGEAAARGFVAVAAREPATALWWLMRSALLRRKTMAVHVAMIEPLPALYRWRDAAGAAPLLVAIVEAAARDAALAEPRLVRRDEGVLRKPDEARAALADAVVQLVALLLRPLRGEWLAAALQLPPAPPSAPKYASLPTRRLLSPRALVEACVLPMLSEAHAACVACEQRSADAGADGDADGDADDEADASVASVERTLALALRLGEAALQCGGDLPPALLAAWLGALLPLALRHAAFRRARHRAYCGRGGIDGEDFVPHAISTYCGGMARRRRPGIDGEECAGDRERRRTAMERERRRGDGCLPIGRVSAATLLRQRVHLARLANAVARAHPVDRAPPLPRSIADALARADWRVRSVCAPLEAHCGALATSGARQPSPAAPASAAAQCARSLERIVWRWGGDDAAVFIDAGDARTRALGAAAALFGIARSDFDRVAHALWSEPQAALPQDDDRSLGATPSASGAGRGAEGESGASLFPPTAAALVARVRWGCALGGTFADALALATATLVRRSGARGASALRARAADGAAFVAPHELGEFIGGIGRFVVSVAEVCVAGNGSDDDAPWLPALRSATLSRLLATVRAAQRRLAAAVDAEGEADAAWEQGPRAQREVRRRAAVGEALVEGELRLRTLALELERRGVAVRE